MWRVLRPRYDIARVQIENFSLCVELRFVRYFLIHIGREDIFHQLLLYEFHITRGVDPYSLRTANVPEQIGLCIGMVVDEGLR